MRNLDGLYLAFSQIRSEKLKSFFAVIGVIIGVMFLIAVVSIIEGVNRYIEEDFSQAIFGINTLTLQRRPEISFESSPDSWREILRRPLLRFADAQAVREKLTVPATVAVSSGGQGRLLSDHGIEVENVRLTGASAEIFFIRNYRIATGRAFTAPEDRTGVPVVVLGFDAAQRLFGQLDPIGRIVKVNNIPFRVVGVLEKQGSLFGMSMDNLAVAPARSAMSRLVAPHGVVDNILIRTEQTADMDQARMDIEATMRTRHRLRPTQRNDFAIDTADETLAFWNRISRVLLIAFPMLVAIALVVGGIVIMNIMLVSVIERTREVGIRKALGARSRDIHLQVLVESALLSGLGAFIGVFIGSALAQIVRSVSPLPAAIAPVWMTVAVVMGLGVGILAGFYPASRAARLDPVVAMRQE